MFPLIHVESSGGNGSRGFAEEAQYRKLAEQAKEPWLRGLLALAYTDGLRRGDLRREWEKGEWKRKPMRCSHEDLLNNTLSLYSGETKNGEPRIVYLTEECRLLVTELRKGKQSEDFLFTRKNGEPIRDLRRAWDPLVAAGLPGLLLHDIRRSAVRNMVRRGVPEKTARTVSSHKSDSIFSGYNIVSGDDIRDAAKKIEAGGRP